VIRLARAMLAPLAFAGLAAVAQTNFPSHTVTITVGFAPGGGTDTAARIVAKKLTESLGVSVVVENRAGAGGNIAAQLIANAPPDGYTISLSSVGPLTVAPAMQKDLAYDPKRDIAPITMGMVFPNIFVVNPSVPAKTLAEFVALAKSRPGALSYASSGVGGAGHLAGELFAMVAKINIVHVPYKGGGPAVADTIGGQVQLLFVSMPAAWQYVKAGKLKAIAVTSATRSVAAPDVPTIAESGVPDYVVDSWYGALAPAKTPPAVVARLNAAFARVLDNPQIRERLLAQGAEAAPSTSAEFDRRIKDELAKWETVIKTAKIRPD